VKPTSSKVVYTAVFGSYDRVLPINPKWDCDFICFTDNPECVSNGWRIEIVQLDGESPSQANRRYKMLPHKYLPNYERSLYIDGNIRIVADPSPLFDKYLDSAAIAIPKHQDRCCAYAEAEICIQGAIVNKEITKKQMERYAEKGFPEKFGLTENGVILRQHLVKNIIALMDLWWEEYCNGGKRDQLSLPYLIWKYKIDVKEVIEGPRISRKFFEIDLHSTDQSKSFLKRFARKANGKKHLNNYYSIVSRIFSLAVFIRDKLKLKSYK
jgi:hypothetical protein